MPVYDYLCSGLRPVHRHAADGGMRCAACSAPSCGALAPRAFLTAPYFSCMSAERRLAHATNERSAHAPQRSGDMKAKHGAGCGCCGGQLSIRKTKRGKDGAKSFPSSRPWMISH